MAEPFRDDLLAELLAAARSLNEYVPPERTRSQPAPAPVNGAAGDRPGDAFNRSATWEEILEPHGWTKVRQFDRHSYWRRPGKATGVSATADYCRTEAQGGLLYVFSSSAAPLEMDTGYSRFAAYAVLNHGGDFAATASSLSVKNYGRPDAPINFRLKSPSPDSVPVPALYRAGTGTESGEGKAGDDPLPLTGEGKPAWPMPIFAPDWRRRPPNEKWIWHGVVSREGITLLSALWKAGKTTLLAHLYRAMGAGGDFCGLAVKPARVLIVSEEDEDTWAERRDELGLGTHVALIGRPFGGRSNRVQWESFLNHLAEQVRAHAFDLLVMDTLSKLWWVEKENDASQVDTALIPLWRIARAGAAVLIVHHLRKGDGGEATASRGSGALGAFPETIIELRRYDAADRKSRRRVLSGYGRYRETPDELVVELTRDHGYRAVGPAHEARQIDLATRIAKRLPAHPPGITTKEVKDLVDARTQAVTDALEVGVSRGQWRREGSGVKGRPHTYWRPLTFPVPVPPLSQGMGTENVSPENTSLERQITDILTGGNLWSAEEVAQHVGGSFESCRAALERLADAGKVDRRSDFDVPTYAATRAAMPVEGRRQARARQIEVLAHLKLSGGPISPDMVAAETGVSPGEAAATLADLIAEGLVADAGEGRFGLTDRGRGLEGPS